MKQLDHPYGGYLVIVIGNREITAYDFWTMHQYTVQRGLSSELSPLFPYFAILTEFLSSTTLTCIIISIIFTIFLFTCYFFIGCISLHIWWIHPFLPLITCHPHRNFQVLFYCSRWKLGIFLYNNTLPMWYLHTHSGGWWWWWWWWTIHILYRLFFL